MIKEQDTGKDVPEKKCQKCNQVIGGKAYYFVRLDCIFDGDSITACESIVLCSDCHTSLKSWLNF
jgi:hypothetical protein